MLLALRPNIDSASARLRTGYHVLSGELRVGRIYKREAKLNPLKKHIAAAENFYARDTRRRADGLTV
jgi:hypothetical protein